MAGSNGSFWPAALSRLRASQSNPARRLSPSSSARPRSSVNLRGEVSQGVALAVGFLLASLGDPAQLVSLEPPRFGTLAGGVDAEGRQHGNQRPRRPKRFR